MYKSINIIFQKQKKEDKVGILYIRTIEGRNVKKSSLKIKLSESDFDKYFNKEKRRFKKSFSESESYNNIIEKRLEELGINGNEIENLPNRRKSFLSYWLGCINNISNHGSKMKHQTILNKLSDYLESINKTDLLFVEITPLFLRQYQNYLTTQRTPTTLSNNTVIHYLKVMKSIINKSKVEDHFTYIKDPFNSLTFSSDKNSKSVLNVEEVEKLLKTPIQDKKIKETRDMFLFQVFSNGMRVSDLFLLRWSNILNGRIVYVMFKTGTEISLPVNLNMGLILSRLIPGFPDYKTIVKKEEIMFYDEEHNLQTIKLGQLNKLIETILNPKLTYNPYVNRLINNMSNEVNKNMGDLIEYKGYSISPSNTQIRMLIDLKENLLDKIEKVFLTNLFDKIKELKKQNSDDFIFPVLSNEMFRDIRNTNKFDKLSLQQYKSIKHHTIVYNRKLKLVQKICEIETPITSHVSRHSFTNLLLRLDNVNLYDISQSLGHSSIKITENYLRSGFNIEKVDYLNNSISKKFIKQ